MRPPSRSPHLIQKKISTENQAYNFSHQVKAIAYDLGFNSFKASQISLGVSEISINAIRYANNAWASVRLTKNKKGIRVQIKDTGPGIEDITEAMKPGISSRNSLGLGLSAAKRSVDEMQIKSNRNGTNITLTNYLPIDNGHINVGSISFPEIGKYFNRDSILIKEYHGESLFIALVDCHAEEKDVNNITSFIKSYLEDNYKLPLKKLLHSCYSSLKSQYFSNQADIKMINTEIIDLSILRITPNKISSISSQNISIIPYSNPIHQPIEQKLVDNENKQWTRTEDKRTDIFCLLMHSDGIKNVDIIDEELHLLSAQKHAEKLYNRHAINNNDATIIVIKLYE
jgi:anti-sigma regulatory factor (Ser/Thr protein kinase)